MTAQIIPLLRLAAEAPVKSSPDHMIARAADISMADKVERWAGSLIRDMERFDRALTAPQRAIILKVVGAIERHPDP